MNHNSSICILGASLPNGNMGVQALAVSLITLLERVCPGIKITILCGGSSGIGTQNVYIGQRFKSVTVCNYRMSPRAKWREHLLIALLAAVLYRVIPVALIRRRLLSASPILDKLVNATFVGDIRGGDSFSDIYGLTKFIMGSLPCLVALILGKELILLPQTYGPFQTSFGRFLARQLVCKAKLIFARDKESLALVSHFLNCKKSCSKAQLCPDVAFCLEPAMPVESAIEPPLPIDSDYRLIGFNVSGLLYHGGYNQNNMFGLRDNYQETVFQVLQFLLSLPNTHVLLLPHMVKLDDGDVENDFYASCQLLDRINPALHSRVHVAAGRYDQHQVKALIGRCNFFIGSRMHACIAALSQGVPTVGIAYSRKFIGVFETVGMSEAALDATRLSGDEIVGRISELYAHVDGIQMSLQKLLPETMAQTIRCFNNRFGTLADEKRNLSTEIEIQTAQRL